MTPDPGRPDHFWGAGVDEGGHYQAVNGNQCGKSDWKVLLDKQESWQQLGVFSGAINK